jgi:hypothetical protein
MDHDRQIELSGKFEMDSQRTLLRLARRMHVVEIEAGLANRNNLL